MSVSKTDIGNMALSHIGISRFMSNMETDKTHEANVVNKWYNTALEYVEADFPWNFNKRYITLSLLAGTPPNEWGYKYAYPASCLKLRFLLPSGVRNPRIEQRITYEVANEEIGGGDVKVIYTDQPDAEACYSKLVTETGLFDAHFVTALSFQLASYIAMSLTAKTNIAAAMQNAYAVAIQHAAVHSAEDDEEGPEAPSEAETYRNS